jgi:hypothetical protein
MGKKGKKHSGKTKPRFEATCVQITGDEVTDKPGVIKVNLFFDGVKGEAKMINTVTNEALPASGMVSGYIGENKWRTTTKINSAPDDHSHRLETKIDRYKHLVAIDTNSVIMHEPLFTTPTKVSVGMAVALIEEHGQSIVKTITHSFLASFNSPKPENENWIQLIELLKTSCQCTDPRHVGIIVDSDLGNMDDFNSRKKPILNDYYLPKGYELIFASDKVTDNLFNQMIYRCHQLATIAIEHMKEQLNAPR